MCPRHSASGQPNPDKDRLYTAVAEKLAHIGDHYMATSPLSDSTSSSVDHTATRRVSARTPNLPGVDERDSESSPCFFMKGMVESNFKKKVDGSYNII